MSYSIHPCRINFLCVIIFAASKQAPSTTTLQKKNKTKEKLAEITCFIELIVCFNPKAVAVSTQIRWHSPQNITKMPI